MGAISPGWVWGQSTPRCVYIHIYIYFFIFLYIYVYTHVYIHIYKEKWRSSVIDTPEAIHWNNLFTIMYYSCQWQVCVTCHKKWHCSQNNGYSVVDTSIADNVLLIAVGAYQQNGVLVIPNCRQTASGRYVCTITMASGVVSQSYATLTITPSQTTSKSPHCCVRCDRDCCVRSQVWQRLVSGVADCCVRSQVWHKLVSGVTQTCVRCDRLLC